MKHHTKQVSKIFDDKQLQIDKKFKNNLINQLTKGPEMKTVKSTKFTKILMKSKFASMAVAVGILGLVAGTSATISGNRAEKSALQGVAIPADLNDVLSIADIKAKAIALAPAGTTISQVELEQEHDGLFYKVKFSDGSFRLFNAKTGEAVDSKVSGVETNGTVPADFSPNISLQNAREIAQNQRPGKTIVKIELENEEGNVVYSVRFSDGGRVDVNATNGSVARVQNGSNTTSTTNPRPNSGGSDDGANHDTGDDNGSSSGSDDNKDSSGSDDDSGSRNRGSGSDDNSGSNSSGSGSGGHGSDDN